MRIGDWDWEIYARPQPLMKCESCPKGKQDYLVRGTAYDGEQILNHVHHLCRKCMHAHFDCISWPDERQAQRGSQALGIYAIYPDDALH